MPLCFRASKCPTLTNEYSGHAETLLTIICLSRWFSYYRSLIFLISAVSIAVRSWPLTVQ
ncbi:hypothetical protein CWS43_18650 [Rahnella sp. AA]|nr:hypothetical protein CWS43_18650 [Rahnella sp. AA]